MRFVKFVLVFIASVLVVSSITAVLYYKSIPKLEENTAILVLGKGGEGHTAPNLTDTIMIVNLNKDVNKVSILSLPRDIWIPEIRAKLNSAYHYGGFKMATDSVTSITNVNIKNTVVVDFSLFKDLIDGMGGITVDVENSFVDEKYPIAGKENDLCNGDKTYKCRYERIEFVKGSQSMNGELALKFVRSRNSVGDEGTDIAREKRQQKVIAAIKDKTLSSEVFLNLKTLENLYNVLVSHIETDVDPNKYLSLVKFIIESQNNIHFLNLPEDMIEVSQNNIKYDRQYVFIPKQGDWQELQKWLSESL